MHFVGLLRYFSFVELKEKPLEYKQIFTDYHETRDVVDFSKHRGRLSKQSEKTSCICVEPSTTVLHFSVFFKFTSRLFAVLISHAAVRDHVHMNYSYAMSPELRHVRGY